VVAITDGRCSSRYSQDEATGGGGSGIAGIWLVIWLAGIWVWVLMAVVGNSMVVVKGFPSGRGPNAVVTRFGTRRSSLE